MKNNLLEFFNERSDSLKNSGSFSGSRDDTSVALYRFIVSNSKANDHDVIEVDSLSNLEDAVTQYFSKSNIDPKSRIIKSENLDLEKQLYVLLELP